MQKYIKKIDSPDNLDSYWDKLANFYFQKKEFLCHLHKFNPCNQVYYELFCDNVLAAGTIVYTLKADILTFSSIRSPIKFQVIGLPVSVASPPIIGNPEEFEYLISEIIKSERGLILGINFVEDYLKDKVVNLRTLPTIILEIRDEDLAGYESSLRHNYRRRLKKIREKFSKVTCVTSDCAAFTDMHYSLYMQIMKKTSTKLEILNLDFFKYLPSNFELTTYYFNDEMLCWHVTCKDETVFFFLFGGMNYPFLNKFQSYNNNLLGIISSAIGNKYKLIDLGQTAEIAKTRLGGELSERRMFLFHRNPFILTLIRLFSPLITYSKTYKKPHVFKSGN